MNCNRQRDRQIVSQTAAAVLPPAVFEESAWDILLALYAHEACAVSLDQLACRVSVPRPVLRRRLAALEERQLITGAMQRSTGELRAVLTRAGREFLDRYLSAAANLHVRQNH